VYRAANPNLDTVAACKVVALTPQTTKQERKELNKEIQVHSTLKHVNILEFIDAFIVEPDGKSSYIPGVYMLLEIAAGGDLFDKIGMGCCFFWGRDFMSEHRLDSFYFSPRCRDRRRNGAVLLQSTGRRYGRLHIKCGHTKPLLITIVEIYTRPRCLPQRPQTGESPPGRDRTN
jgi:hypothetical protein